MLFSCRELKPSYLVSFSFVVVFTGTVRLHIQVAIFQRVDVEALFIIAEVSSSYSIPHQP
jgi:hypothetical protein